MAAIKSSKRSFQYIKNAGKSLGYAFVDVMKEFNPVLTKMTEDTKEVSKDIYQSIKSFKESKADSSSNLVGNAKGAIGDIWNNLKDDLKSGNWYNKQRDIEFDNALMKSIGFDMDLDMDFDFDDDNFNFDESPEIGQDIKNTQATILALDSTGAKISGAVNEGTIASANYIVKSNRQMSSALYELNSRGFSKVTEALMNLNSSTINMANSIGQPLTTHISNSQIFFTHMEQKLDAITESLKATNQALTQIAKNTTPLQVSSNKSYKKSKGLDDLLDDGVFSISAYKEMLGGKLKDYTSLFGNGGEGNGIEKLRGLSKAYSPMKAITTGVVKSMVPSLIKDAMTSFNESLKDLIPGLINKARHSNRNNIGLWFLKDFLLPQDSLKTNLSTNGYNKGAVPWDGIARKALIEVIPTTLFKIYSAITGKEDFRYDYEKGIFVTTASIEKDRNKRKQDYINRAGGDLKRDSLRVAGKGTKEYDELNKYFTSIFESGNITGDAYTGLSEEARLILDNLTKQGRVVTYNSDYSKDIDRIKKNKNLTQRQKNELIKYYENLQANGITRKHYSKYNDIYRNNAKYRKEYSDEMARLEAEGTTVELSLENKSNKVFGKNIGHRLIDEYKNDSLFYLRGIYLNTGGNSSDSSSNASSGGERTRSQSTQDIRREVNDDTNLEEEIEEALTEASSDSERQAKLNELRDSISDRVTDTKTKLRNLLGKVLPPTIIKFFDSSVTKVANFFDKMTENINKFLWDENGIFTTIKNKFKEKMSKFFDPVKNFFKNAWSKTKEQLGVIGSSLFGTVSGAYQNVRQRYINRQEQRQAAADWTNFANDEFYNGGSEYAYGGQIPRTGIYALSEGEMVIPSEFNPFFKGNSNKAQQYRNEKTAIDNYRRYDGIRVGSRNRARSYRGVKMAAGGEESAAADGDPNSKLASIIFNFAKDKITTATDFLFGKGTLKEKGNAIKDKINENIGTIGAGGVLGFAGGAFLGSPLLGALVGSTIGYISKSQKAQNFLFGELDEEGNRKGGFLPKEFSNILTKTLPSIGKGAALGFAGGAFLGSPVLGAIVGSSIGYVSKSQKAQEFLFGKTDEEGNEIKKGVISKKFQDKIKKAYPSIGIGAIAGLLAGPFGAAVPNIMLGSALGYASTTEKVKHYFFGDPNAEDEKKKQGLLGRIQDKVLGNITEIFANMGNRLKTIGKILLNRIKIGINNIGKKISNFVTGKEKSNSLLGRIIQGAITAPISAVVGTAGALTKGINNKIKRTNLRKGYDIFDRKKGRNLTAQERVNLRNQLGPVRSGADNKFDRFDQILSSIKDEDQMNMMLEGLDKVGDGSAESREMLKEWSNKLGGTITTNDLVKMKELAKSEQKGRKLKTAEDKSRENIEVGIIALAKEFTGISLKPSDPAVAGKLLTKMSKDGRELHYFVDSDRKMKPIKKSEYEEFKAQGYTEDEGEVEKTLTVFDLFGNPHKKVKDKNGDYTNVKNDKDTDNSDKIINNTTEGLGRIPTFLETIHNTMTGFFNKVGETLFGTKENPTWLGKVKNFLGGILKTSILPILGAIGLISGKFDGILHIISGGALGDKKQEYVATTDSGESVVKDENGIYRYANDSLDGKHKAGDQVIEHIDVSKGDADTASTSAKKGLFKTGATSLSKINMLSGKALGKIAKSPMKVTAKNKVLTKATQAAVQGAGDDLGKSLYKMFKKVPVLNKITEAVATKFGKALQTMTEKAIKKSGVAAAKATYKQAASATIIAGIVMATTEFAAAFANGFSDANATFSILTEPTFGQKVISGLIRGLKAAVGYIPVVGIPLELGLSLVPDSMIIDLIVDILGPVLKIDFGDLSRDRQAAQEEVERYNAEHGTNLTFEQYNKQVAKNYSLSERFSNIFKTNRENRKNLKAIAAANVDQYNAENGTDLSERQYYRLLKKQSKEDTRAAKKEARLTKREERKEARLDKREKRKTIRERTRDIRQTEFQKNKDQYIAASAAIESILNSDNIKFKDDLKKIWKIEGPESGNFGSVFNFSLSIEKISASVQLLFKSLVNKVKNVFTKIKEIIPDWILNPKDAASNLWNNVKDKASGAWDKIKSFFTGSGSGFVSQLDPKYSGYSMAGGSFGQQGCAPSVASMVASAYGKNLSVRNAYNMSSRYQNGAGVSSDYFSAALGSKGISTRYETNPYNIASSIYGGGNTILLGSDPYNTSKQNSPFGPGNHYVMASGYDKNGNIIIKDPENNRPRAYSPSILNSVKMGVLTGGDSGLLDSITSIFTNGLSNYFSSKSNDSSTTYDNNVGLSTVPEGSKGSGGRGINTTNLYNRIDNKNINPKQIELVNKMNSIYGQIKYSTTAPQNPDKGTASCASTVGWAYNKVLGVEGMSAGAGPQAKDDRFTTIYTNDGKNLVDESKLMPGDILYHHWQRGENRLAHVDDGHMSHVEMYAGDGKNGKILSHGGPMNGPVEKKLNDYRKHSLMLVRRYNGFITENNVPSDVSAKKNSNKNPNLIQQSAAGSGLIPHFVGGASALNNMRYKSTNMLSNMASNIRTAQSNGYISAELMQQLLTAIIQILQSIANNTAPVGQIYSTLSNFKQTTNIAKSTTKSTTKTNQSNIDDITSGFKNVVGQLAALAKA